MVLMNELNFLPNAQRKEVQRKEAVLVDIMVDLLTQINPGRMADVKVPTPKPKPSTPAPTCCKPPTRAST